MAIQKADRIKSKHLLRTLPRKTPPLIKRRNKAILNEVNQNHLPDSYFSNWGGWAYVYY